MLCPRFAVHVARHAAYAPSFLPAGRPDWDTWWCDPIGEQAIGQRSGSGTGIISATMFCISGPSSSSMRLLVANGISGLSLYPSAYSLFRFFHHQSSHEFRFYCCISRSHSYSYRWHDGVLLD